MTTFKAWSPVTTIKTGIMKSIVICCLCFAGISCSNNSSQGNADMDLIPVKSGESWGYINPKGEYVINPQFADADFFRDGLAWVKSADGKVGYISKDGKYKIAAEYKDGTPFSEGLAFVVAAGKAPACIDKSGKEKFVLQQAKWALSFSEGLAAFYTADDKAGFVDESGKVVVNPQFDRVLTFSNGLAAVWQNSKWGFIDKSGNFVINPQFDYVNSLSEGMLLFSNGKKYGFADKKGNYVINPQFDKAGIFNEGLAEIKSGSKYGFITKDGKIEINPQFDDAKFFQNELAAFKQNSEWGFIDKKGKIVINPQFDDVSSFSGNVAFVKSGKQWGIIDKNGKYTVNPQFDEIKTLNFLLKGYHWFFVGSDYYDTSEFINKFFERASGNSFDGFNGNSTLQTIIDNATYGNGANARYNDEYAVDYKKSQRLTSDISISQVSFHANNPFYTGSYYNKAYRFDTKVTGISYKFSLSGEAKNRSETIMNALIAEIEKRCNLKMEKTVTQDRSFGDDLYTAYQDGKISFVISDNLTLFVGFDKESLQQLFRPVEFDCGD